MPEKLYTNEYIDNFLKDKQIKRVDNISNSTSSINFICENGHITKKEPKSLFKGHYHCSKCPRINTITK